LAADAVAGHQEHRVAVVVERLQEGNAGDDAY